MINGKKTYLSIAAYVLYSVAVYRRWIGPIEEIDLMLKGAMGAAFTHKIQKLIYALKPSSV